MAVHSASQMVKMFQDDPNLLKQLSTSNAAQQTLKVLKKTANQAESKVLVYIGDKRFYYVVICELGGVLQIATLGSIGLAVRSISTPDILVALGSAAIGALAGLFAPSPVGQQ